MNHDDTPIEAPRRDALQRDYVIGGALPALLAANMSVKTCAAMLAPPAPDWFKHKETRPMPYSPDPMLLSAADRDELSRVKSISTVTWTTPAVRKFLDQLARQAAWREEQKQAKYWAWRWYYADQIAKGAPDA